MKILKLVSARQGWRHPAAPSAHADYTARPPGRHAELPRAPCILLRPRIGWPMRDLTYRVGE
jgi:hypothetical protein